MIYISQHNDLKLPFMYYPAVNSLMKILPYIYGAPILYNNEILIKNDIFIWVGIGPNFNGLKEKGVYTIHYNLEPYVENSESDETWTYSLYLYEEHKQLNKIIKFIPIIHDETLPFTNYVNKTSELTFIGHFAFERKNKIDIIETCGIKVNEVSNLWSDYDYNSYIINNSPIYLNITKWTTKTLASVRNKLLSHKCIIIYEL